jgi:hypothetical protein
VNLTAAGHFGSAQRRSALDKSRCEVQWRPCGAKTEVIKPRGPWRTLDAVEYATAEWVDWFNHRRL